MGCLVHCRYFIHRYMLVPKDTQQFLCFLGVISRVSRVLYFILTVMISASPYPQEDVLWETFFALEMAKMCIKFCVGAYLLFIAFSRVIQQSKNKWRLRNERRNSILMTCHYPDLGGASDWLNQISHMTRPIKSTTQIWVSSVWNFCACFSDVIWQGNQWWRCEMLAVFSG